MFKNFHPSKQATIIGSIIGIVVIAAIAIGVIYLIGYENTVNRVKSDLVNVGKAMEASHKQTTVYPVSIPTSAAKTNDGVKLNGGGSFDGVSYCVSGTSQYQNRPITFHLDSTTSSQGPQPNGCISPVNVTPSAPLDLVINSMNAEDITASWTSSTGARAYALQCATDNQFTTGIVNARATKTTGTCGNLKPATLYYIRVKGLNSTKGGDWSSSVTMTTAVLSVVPTNFKVTAISSTEVSYSWDPVPGALSYNLQQSTDVNFIKDLINKSQTATSGTISNLKPNTMYFYHVLAVTPEFNTLSAAYSNELIVSTSR